MSKPLPYYPLYVQDFDESAVVMDMTLDEVGLYVLALNESWKRGSIPADLKSLALRIRRPLTAVKKAWPKVSARWQENGTPGFLVNPRQEKERAKAKDKSEQARENVRRRYGGSTGVVTDVATDETTEAPTPALIRGSESVSSSGSKSLKQKYERYEGQDADFEVFWSRYWRKIAKSSAADSFRKMVISKEIFGLVLTSVAIQAPLMLARDPDKRPHGSTWLNQRRWEDEMAGELERVGPQMSRGEAVSLKAMEIFKRGQV